VAEEAEIAAVVAVAVVEVVRNLHALNRADPSPVVRNLRALNRLVQSRRSQLNRRSPAIRIAAQANQVNPIVVQANQATQIAVRVIQIVARDVRGLLTRARAVTEVSAIATVTITLCFMTDAVGATFVATRIASTWDRTTFGSIL
jgi:hypothetical protein